MTGEGKILRNEEIPHEAWNDLLSQFPYPSYFQSPKGFKELRLFNGWQVEALAIMGEKRLEAIVVYVIQKEKGLKSIFSKRCIIFSGPVFQDQSSLNRLLKVLNEQVSGCVYIEVRNGYPSQEYKSCYQSCNWQYIPWLNFIVNTNSRDAMWSAVSESRRRQLKKAEKLGAYCANPKSESDVKSFYIILKDLYLSKVKKPLPQYEFFRQYFLSDHCNFVLVYFKSQVIGGILCPFLEGVGSYEFYVAGLDQEFKECFPSAMATYGAMKQSNDMGLPFFDFMGGGSPEEGYGVREFKSRFGGEQVAWGRWLQIRNKFIYRLGKWYIQRKAR